ncbi:MAG: response regulator [Candidatus Omnitrophota bacterium]
MAKILMIDDDQDFLAASKAVLESQGHQVVLADNALTGEASLATEKPDLVLLDIMMEQPDDGIALAHKLRKKGVKIPIVILSAVSKVTGYDYGKCDEVLPCNAFLQKPVSPKDLIKKVEGLLKK